MNHKLTHVLSHYFSLSLPFLPTISSLPRGNENRSPAVNRTHHTVHGYIQQQPLPPPPPPIQESQMQLWSDGRVASWGKLCNTNLKWGANICTINTICFTQGSNKFSYRSRVHVPHMAYSVIVLRLFRDLPPTKLFMHSPLRYLLTCVDGADEEPHRPPNANNTRLYF